MPDTLTHDHADTPSTHASSGDQFPPTSIARIQTELIGWYAGNARDLPWRKPNVAPWAILVCEVMSQQTPVSRVAPAWHAWLEQWPTPEALAHASPAEVIVAWDRLGYPSRALRLRDCARRIVERHGGQVPSDRSELLALPGIGAYTADAVLAFAFQIRTTVLDTNIRRVLARWHGEALPAPSEKPVERIRATHFVPESAQESAQWNAAIMEFGALVCTAKSPRCDECIASQWCAWRHNGYPEDTYRHTRKTQKFTGTLREARGQIMAPLRRAGESTLSYAELHAAATSNPLFDSALASLVADGLIEQTESGYRLPQNA
ncbi:MAG: A/G-specific adenine glycosylase [Actinomycetaceae bacterium]|nr:A/G-specific adenine glycosylase [Arcanobacterium sp.]MDD7504947.1 A/G-specific adenine glycosylase [Actinomycetaceae bacterium]MDY6143293.1 A/G-specific adenine glycosylase [Arcanobacterium sp.]